MLDTPASRPSAPPSAGNAAVQAERIDPAFIAPSVRTIMQCLDAAGHQVWLTGQHARDLIDAEEAPPLRRVELLSDATLTEITTALENAQPTPLHVEKRSPRSVSVRSEREEESKATIHVSMLRTAASSTRSQPDRSLTGLDFDLATREITLHAFAISPDGEVLDPFGGVADFRNKTLRTIIPPKRAFRESGMWLLKIAKYVAYYGFEVPPDMVNAARHEAGSILDVPTGTLKDSLDKVLLSHNVISGLDFLRHSGVLTYILPEVDAMVGFHKSCRVHHKDLWDHTVKVIAKAERDLVVRWAALMHDIGKIATRSVNWNGKVHFFRHEELSARLFRGAAARLEFDPAFCEDIAYVIEYHSRVNLYDSSWTDSAVRRLITECGDKLERLLSFSRADFTTKRESKARALREQVAELEGRIAAIRIADAQVPALPSGLGNAIMGHFQLKPGRIIGDLKRWLEDEIEAERIAAHQEMDVYLAHLEAHRDTLTIPSPQAD